MQARKINKQIKHTSDIFYRFKLGSSSLAFPLALAIYRALQERNLLDFDCIIPIPLSPDKAQDGEIHRTLLLARELARLLGTPVRDFLTLTHAISKHKLRTDEGLNAKEFEPAYRNALLVDPRARSQEQILLLDDVCTEGSTLRCCVEAIKEIAPDCTITAVTGGQMILSHVVSQTAELTD